MKINRVVLERRAEKQTARGRVPRFPPIAQRHVISRLGPSGGQVRKAAEVRESRVGDRTIVTAGARICPPGQSTPVASGYRGCSSAPYIEPEASHPGSPRLPGSLISAVS